MGIYTADLCDQHSDKLDIVDNIFKLYGARRCFSGTIHTVKVLDDNVLVKEALQTIPSGSVLVVDGGGSRNCALIGDNLAHIAVKRKLAGIIVNGCIRDSAQINEMDIGIYCIGTHPLKSIKRGKGERGISIQFAGALFEPGAYLYADEDGIVLSQEALD
ncbi:ribonuclease E inhibitor RraA [Halalkalibacter wakoensis JCM 9140]|uniref:4-hydroxy-4-methyl-2-oxoglutarate aldolase n=1 Tax=Halalkalibacter wakoensis JCM 9140 TaxID=1236970 RepID=W4PZE9_9BACI|nr:ribonuclease E activity regulator RraA [Halalkalibacter wakoensis]GAE25216.1 ribonuclease E inhibitor RraA [Halalkalibacter wakoensis JCM 9140]